MVKLEQTFFGGVIGIVLLLLGLFILLAGLSVLLGATILSLIFEGVAPELFAFFQASSLVAIVVSVVALILGFRFTLENENRFLKIMLGIVGLFFIVGGIGITLISGLTATAVGIVLVVIGVVLVGFAFGVKQLTPVRKTLLNVVNNVPILGGG